MKYIDIEIRRICERLWSDPLSQQKNMPQTSTGIWDYINESVDHRNNGIVWEHK